MLVHSPPFIQKHFLKSNYLQFKFTDYFLMRGTGFSDFFQIQMTEIWPWFWWYMGEILRGCREHFVPYGWYLINIVKTWFCHCLARVREGGGGFNHSWIFSIISHWMAPLRQKHVLALGTEGDQGPNLVSVVWCGLPKVIKIYHWQENLFVLFCSGNLLLLTKKRFYQFYRILSKRSWNRAAKKPQSRIN